MLMHMKPYLLHLPSGQAVPIVANLPHSGMIVPDAIAAQFLPEHLAHYPILIGIWINSIDRSPP
jgi:N-formylglutamate amidohydrolase